jgi:hypothetical protein
MIQVRQVFQCKYGRGDQLVALFKEADAKWRQRFPALHQRVMTDVAGEFFTVVTEMEVESLAAWEALLPQMFSDPEFGPWFARMQEVVESGRREFWTIAS